MLKVKEIQYAINLAQQALEKLQWHHRRPGSVNSVSDDWASENECERFRCWSGKRLIV